MDDDRMDEWTDRQLVGSTNGDWETDDGWVGQGWEMDGWMNEWMVNDKWIMDDSGCLN